MTQIAQAFLLAAERLGRECGTPLPKQVLEVGDAEHGWHLTMNLTPDDVYGLPEWHIAIKWNGWPAGILSPQAGMMAAGEAANEDSLCEWLQSDLEADA